MRRPTPRHLRWAQAALFVLTLTLGAACVEVPDSGPVRAGPEVGADEEPVLRYVPRGPTAGADPVTVINGYLDAMRAYPPNPGIVGRFLTDEAVAEWSPEAGVQIYTERPQMEEVSSGGVAIETQVLARLTARGEWVAPPADAQRLRREFRLERENGEWRIANPASGLLLPEYAFERYYRPYSLYFFDPALRILVPEQVYLPQGEQTATLLLRGLQRGPTEWLRGAVDSLVPVTGDADVSVPVSDRGVAEVQLSAAARGLGTTERELLAAQLCWTLRQVSNVDAIQVSVGGAPLPIEGSNLIDVEEGSEYDPADSAASQALFALRGGRVVQIDSLLGTATPIPGLFGNGGPQVDAFAVDRTAQVAAAVTDSRTSVEVAPFGAESSQVWFDRGRSLLGVQWDFHGLLWAVDNTRRGPDIYVLRDGRWAEVAQPDAGPSDIQAFSLSRDGLRLAVIEGSGESSRLLVGRVRRPAGGALTAAVDRWREITVPQVPLRSFVDLAWSSPTELAVVAEEQPGARQTFAVSIDGSAVEPSALANSDVVSVAHAPVADLPTVVGTDAGALLVQQSDRWSDLELEGHLRQPSYVE